MVIATKAIVLSSLKFGDSDLIVKCFTSSSGLKSYLLRNILKSKKGKLKVSLFQPLTILEIEASHKNKGNLERIKEAKVYYSYQTLHTQIVKSSMTIFIAEILITTINEEAEDIDLFNFIEESLLWLDQSDKISNFHILFLLKLSIHFGFYPDTDTVEKPYFNLMEGVFQDLNADKYSERSQRVANLKEFFGIDFDKSYEINLTKIERSDLLTLLLQYYQLHLHGFKNPKSLVVLNQIFE
mgnify:FL=1